MQIMQMHEMQVNEYRSSSLITLLMKTVRVLIQYGVYCRFFFKTDI